MGYFRGRPALGIQITTARDNKIKAEKYADLANRPFIRLPEMRPTDAAMFRSLVFLDAPDDIQGFRKDRDFSKHPLLEKQILESSINSFKYTLTRTKNPKEKELIQTFLNVFIERLNPKKNRQGPLKFGFIFQDDNFYVVTRNEFEHQPVFL